MNSSTDTSTQSSSELTANGGYASVVHGVDLEASPYYREVDEKAELSAAVVQKIQQEQEAEPGGFAHAITGQLEELLALGKLDGLTIASADGLVIAESSRLPNGEIMAAIGSVFEYVADRAQNSDIVTSVDEMTLLGSHGEFAVVRYFPNLERRFFLIAYTRQRCSYRRITTLVLKKCGPLLERKFGNS